MAFVDWLRVFRAHTSPSTVLCVEIFYLLGGATFFSLENLVILIWATLIHWAGFGHNSLMDTARGYDSKDRSKKHHPLVSGEISLDSAHNVIHWLIIALAGFTAAFILWFSTGNKVYSALGFMVYVVMGHAYDDGLNKSSFTGFIPEAASYTGLCLSVYYFTATAASQVFLFAALYMFLVGAYQIAYLGYLKDINLKDEANLLRRLGVKVDKGYFTNTVKGRCLAYGIRFSGIASLFMTGMVSISLSLSGVLTFLLLVSTVVFTVLLVENRKYDHEKDLKYCAAGEIGAIFLLPLVLSGVLGELEVLLLLGYAIAWFVGMNRVLWGTLIKPRV